MTALIVGWITQEGTPAGCASISCSAAGTALACSLSSCHAMRPACILKIWRLAMQTPRVVTAETSDPIAGRAMSGLYAWRDRLAPKAGMSGFHTDEDVFKAVS